MIVINKEWEKALVFRLGRYSREFGPGLNFKLPFIERIIRRDMRTRAIDMPKQAAITRDNISVIIDAVMLMRITDAKKSVIDIEDFSYAIQQRAQTALRNIAGTFDLDNLLSKRQDIAVQLKEVVDVDSDDWGIDIRSVELQNILLPEDMKRAMAVQAEADREARAIKIKAKAELEASKDYAKAAEIMKNFPSALELRKLETLTDVSKDQSNTIVFAMPLEQLDKIPSIGMMQPPKPRKIK
jgi:regulator of protease activity HflC (stomatin/prohibitin superfamily)